MMVAEAMLYNTLRQRMGLSLLERVHLKGE